LDTLEPANRLDFSQIAAELGKTPEALSFSVNKALAEVASLVHAKTGLSALFVSGGDVAVSVCREFLSRGIRLVDEVMPLAAFGFLDGGAADGLPIVTKGGLVGGEDAMLLCLEYLNKAIRITRHSGEHYL
jgi:uncharacterized protein YgbK (DUF1537 family)